MTQTQKWQLKSPFFTSFRRHGHAGVKGFELFHVVLLQVLTAKLEGGSQTSVSHVETCTHVIYLGFENDRNAWFLVVALGWKLLVFYEGRHVCFLGCFPRLSSLASHPM